MHDLDRTAFEAGSPGYESEYEGERAFEALYEGGPTGGREAQELELASELLEVGTAQELDQFIGNLVSRAAGAASGFASSPAGRQLTGVLRQAARRALPIVGRAAGEWVRPGGGTAGARIASSAGSLFGLELEGLSDEDRELEVARGFIRFATDASRRLVVAPRAMRPPDAVRVAVTRAAQRHAPGLLGRPGRRRSGRWERRGGSIVIHGI